MRNLKFGSDHQLRVLLWSKIKIDDIFRQPRYLLGPVAIRDAKIKKQSATNLANSWSPT